MSISGNPGKVFIAADNHMIQILPPLQCVACGSRDEEKLSKVPGIGLHVCPDCLDKFKRIEP